jgi:hypothetical protein
LAREGKCLLSWSLMTADASATGHSKDGAVGAFVVLENKGASVVGGWPPLCVRGADKRITAGAVMAAKRPSEDGDDRKKNRKDTDRSN